MSSPNRSYQLNRSIPYDSSYDIVVAGGGPAGCGAAICAARLGAKVLLLESLGALGGIWGVTNSRASIQKFMHTLDGQNEFQLTIQPYRVEYP